MNARGRGPAGWGHLGVTHADVVDLLYGLGCDNPHAPDTWKYRDRYLTSHEQSLVRGATDEQWQDAATLRALDNDEHTARLGWLRTMQSLTDQLDQRGDDKDIEP